MGKNGIWAEEVISSEAKAGVATYDFFLFFQSRG